MPKNMKMAVVFTVVAISVGVAACHGMASEAGASRAGASAVPGSYASGGTKTVSITDPILNMTAYTLTIPADWVFSGAVIQGSSCASGPFPVFRMSSPDGLTGIKQLPRLDWAWSDSSAYRPPNAGDCMNLKQEMTATDVLKYMVGVLKVQYVRDDVNPNREEFQRNIASRNSATYITTVRFVSGWVAQRTVLSGVSEDSGVSTI